MEVNGTVVLGPRDHRVLGGHPWVFDNEVRDIRGNPVPGDVVDVVTGGGNSRGGPGGGGGGPAGRFVGRGYINQNSKILVRLMTRKKTQPVDENLITERLERAWDYRRRLGWGGPEDSCRVVFAEADFLPGLIVDKFGPVAVVQTLAYGLDRRKALIFEQIKKITGVSAVVERNDAPVRELEGLPQTKGVVLGKTDRYVRMVENGLTFIVDVLEGQKTGYFLDQKENRRALLPYAAGAEVLDAFCYTGSFTVHAAAAGASSVLSLDVSEDAVALARENAAANGLSGSCTFETGNAFDRLRELGKEGRTFDLVVLDPPAFARSRHALEGAISGYKEINLRAMKLLRPGGFLVSCSCSQHVSEELFLEMLAAAAADSRRAVRLLEMRSQAHDHPTLLVAPEGRYLKFVVLQIDD